MLKKLNIIVAKFPASCSGLFQPSDVSTMFRVIKYAFRTVAGSILLTQDEDVQDTLSHFFDTVLPKQHKIVFPAGKKKAYIKALEVLSIALKEKVKQSQIVAGYMHSVSRLVHELKVFGIIILITYIGSTQWYS